MSDVAEANVIHDFIAKAIAELNPDAPAMPVPTRSWPASRRRTEPPPWPPTWPR